MIDLHRSRAGHSKEGFTNENGLLTPTLKIKRHQVLQRYAAEIEQVFAQLEPPDAPPRNAVTAAPPA